MSLYSLINREFHLLIASLAISLSLIPSAWSQATHELGAPVQISGDMVPFGDLISYKISPDGNYVVYTANQDNKDLTELYVAAIDGGDSRKLSSAQGIRDVADFVFEISPDSRTVLFIDTGITGFRLNVANLDGSDQRALSLDLENIDTVTSLALLEKPFSPNDFSKVFFYARLANARRQLYSVNTDGSNLTQLSGLSGNAFDKETTRAQISSDGLTAVYDAFDTDFFSTVKIFSIALDDETAVAVRIDDAAENEASTSPEINADNTRVVFSGRRGGQATVRSAPLRGGTNVQLNQLGEVRGNTRLSPDGNHVVFIADHGINKTLISVPVSGGTNTPLFSAPVHQVQVVDFVISPDSRYVIYAANIDRQDTLELYRSTLGVANSHIKLHPDSRQGKSLLTGTGIRVSPDSKHVAYISEFNFDDVFEGLYAPINGGPRGFLNPLSFSLITDTFIPISNIEFTPDSANIIYLARTQFSTAPGGTQDSLFFLPVGNDDPNSVVQVNSSLPFTGKVRRASISPNSDYIVYSADQDVAGDIELYSVKINKIVDELCVPIKAKQGAIVVVCV